MILQVLGQPVQSVLMELSLLLGIQLVQAAMFLALLVMKVLPIVLLVVSTMNQLGEMLAVLVVSEITVLKATFLVNPVMSLVMVVMDLRQVV